MTATAKSDEAAAATGEPDQGDQVAAVDTRKAADQDVTDEGAGSRTEATDAADHADNSDVIEDDADVEDDTPRASSGVASGAAAVVSAVLGFAALTGTWTSRVAAERETLIGQLGTQQTDSPADQVAALYGNGWHMTALVNGGFATLAIVVAVAVLARPAFGTPGAVRQASWVRSVAWAGVAIGVLGLILATGMYLDLFATMPTPPAGAGGGAGQ